MYGYLITYSNVPFEEAFGTAKIKTIVSFETLKIIKQDKEHYTLWSFEKVNIEDFLKSHIEILYDERAIKILEKDFPQIWDAVNNVITLPENDEIYE